jgi:DNA repair protein RecO (recombination protein O)
MDESAIGIISRVRPLTESSLIVEWVTHEVGRLSTVAKGARKPKSAYRGRLDLFFKSNLTYRRSRRSDLHALREVKTISTNGHLRLRMRRLEDASFCLKLIEMATERDTPIPECFILLDSVIGELEGDADPSIALCFECLLLEVLGLMPALESIPVSPQCRQALGDVSLRRMTLGSEVKTYDLRELEQYLKGYWIYNYGRWPRTEFIT